MMENEKLNIYTVDPRATTYTLIYTKQRQLANKPMVEIK